jgi:hypothetical protein
MSGLGQLSIGLAYVLAFVVLTMQVGLTAIATLCVVSWKAEKVVRAIRSRRVPRAPDCLIAAAGSLLLFACLAMSIANHYPKFLTARHLWTWCTSMALCCGVIFVFMGVSASRWGWRERKIFVRMSCVIAGSRRASFYLVIGLALGEMYLLTKFANNRESAQLAATTLMNSVTLSLLVFDIVSIFQAVLGRMASLTAKNGSALNEN